MKFLKTILLILFFALFSITAFGANIAFCYLDRDASFFNSRVISNLTQEGHTVDLRYTWFVPDDTVDYALYFIADRPPDSTERASFRSWIRNGGNAYCIGFGEWFVFEDDAWHVFLNDPEWKSDIGGMEHVYWYPPSSLPYLEGWHCDEFPGCKHTPYTRFYPPLNGSFLDTVYGAPETRIIFTDSASAEECGVLMRGDPVLLPGDSLGWIFGAYAKYGRGTFNLFISSAILFSINLGVHTECGYPDLLWFIDYGDNAQFVRNLFTTNDRADSVWLNSTDSTFTVFLPHCTPFVAGSTSFSFESAAYGLWERRASDWHHWHTDSSITIQYPDTCPMGVTFEVCVNLVPDSTGETVLPTGPVCDSFAFNYTGIAEDKGLKPLVYEISAWPNPFNSAVTITAPAGAEVEVFDVNGRRIAERIPPAPPLTRGEEERKSPLSKGDLGGLFIWRPDPSLGSGVYLVRARLGACETSRRVVYLK